MREDGSKRKSMEKHTENIYVSMPCKILNPAGPPRTQFNLTSARLLQERYQA